MLVKGQKVIEQFNVMCREDLDKVLTTYSSLKYFAYKKNRTKDEVERNLMNFENAVSELSMSLNYFLYDLDFQRSVELEKERETKKDVEESIG